MASHQLADYMLVLNPVLTNLTLKERVTYMYMYMYMYKCTAKDDLKICFLIKIKKTKLSPGGHFIKRFVSVVH